MNTPSHEAVAQCARELWQKHGRPDGRDTEIWLEAEQQLSGAVADPSSAVVAEEVAKIVSASISATGPAELAGAEAAHASSLTAVVATTPMPGGVGARVTKQKQMARAPKLPSKTAPKVLPAESGKPLWDKPHSS